MSQIASKVLVEWTVKSVLEYPRWAELPELLDMNVCMTCRDRSPIARIIGSL